MSLNAYIFLALLLCFAHINEVVSNSGDALEALETLGLTFAFIIYLMPFSVFVAGLMTFHIHLALNGITTREFMKKENVRGNKRGIISNIKYFFCKEVPTVQFNYKNVVLTSNLHKFASAFSQDALVRNNRENNCRDANGVSFM